MAASAMIALCSCDSHRDFPDTGLKVGHVLCSDGSLGPAGQCLLQGKEPVGVVFHVNPGGGDAEMGDGFAISLRDLPPKPFSETPGEAQGTSASTTAFDGNSNTYALYANDTVPSPLAGQVFDVWRYRQSAYVPSVAQMRLLWLNRNAVDAALKEVGGDPLPDNPDGCWYWTSTEVKGQEAYKAWLFSLLTGAYQETSKTRPFPTRPVITINR